ncbi:hypothetical protein J4223_03780 [Candidatus Woesearchaeota archaeon]|nr:hypothetical protein [Candidatus Woesearchaeota archaeon]
MECENECSPENFEFMNGRASTIEKIIDEPNSKFYRIQANLNSQIDLKKFPFDSQQLEIILEDKEKTNDELVYVANMDQSGIDDSIAFSGWNLDGWNAEVSEHTYSVYDETYSQYIYSINISRIFFNAFLKTFLPVIFTLLVILCSFLIDTDKITTRLAMASSSLVAAVMFHVSISNQIPPVGYLTFADKFMILTYFVLLFTFTLNILILELQEQKKNDLAERIHRKTEYAVFFVIPIIYLLLFLIFA